MPLTDRKCQCGHHEEDLIERPICPDPLLCPQCGGPTFQLCYAAPNFSINGDTIRALDFWDKENSNCDGVYGKSYTTLDLRDKKMGKHVEYSK